MVAAEDIWYEDLPNGHIQWLLVTPQPQICTPSIKQFTQHSLASKMSVCVSVGWTPQTTDIVYVTDMSRMLALHVGDILLSRPFLADKVVSVFKS
jgi:hypothetical protein